MQPEFTMSPTQAGLVGSSKPRTDGMGLLALKTSRQQNKKRVGVVSLPWNCRTAPALKMDFFLPHMEQREMLCREQGDSRHPSFLARIGSGPPFVL